MFGSITSGLGSIGRGLFGDSQDSSDNRLDSQFKNAFFDNLNQQQGMINNMGPRQIAGFNDQYHQGADAMQQNAFGGMGALNQAQNMAGNPQQVNAQQVNAQSMPGMNMAGYLNPHTQNVVDASMNDLNRSRQMAMNDTGDSAFGAGAFGGSRHGVAEAETNRAFMDQAGQMSAGLRQQGFDSASNLMQQDMGRNLQAQGMNQSTGLQAQGMNQSTGLQAAGMMGQLGQQQQNMGMQGSQALMNLGLAQQGLQQQQNDAQYEHPMTQMNLMNQALGVNPGGGAGMVGTSQGSSTGGLLPGLGEAGAGLGAFAEFVPLSDPAAKTDVVKLTETGKGLGVYQFRYREGIEGVDPEPTHVGVMADEVEAVLPEAVSLRPDGFRQVDYAAVAAAMVEGRV